MCLEQKQNRKTRFLRLHRVSKGSRAVQFCFLTQDTRFFAREMSYFSRSQHFLRRKLCFK